MSADADWRSNNGRSMSSIGLALMLSASCRISYRSSSTSFDWLQWMQSTPFIISQTHVYTYINSLIIIIIIIISRKNMTVLRYNFRFIMTHHPRQQTLWTLSSICDAVTRPWVITLTTQFRRQVSVSHHSFATSASRTSAGRSLSENPAQFC